MAILVIIFLRSAAILSIRISPMQFVGLFCQILCSPKFSHMDPLLKLKIKFLKACCCDNEIYNADGPSNRHTMFEVFQYYKNPRSVTVLHRP